MDLSTEHIVSDPEICFGKPRIAGTRFAVKFVVAHHHFQRMSLEEIALDWNVPLAAVYAAMAYYYDHKAEIDQSFKDDEDVVRQLKTERGSILDHLRERFH
ncbi:MAG TPA: DUF433 domain-containing protein [Candidatus Kapabacteria bacterium]|jgi:uncharacterized protein (DUF433 family)|nr:DUF433 domain-containing protein [Candidatus Kapabacteria bacterium]